LIGEKDWVFVACVLVIVGYILPMFYVSLEPMLSFHWIDSLLITFLATLGAGSFSFLWFLLPVPLALAIIGWVGVSVRPRLIFLRIGFYPSSLLVILLLILSIYLATFHVLFVPVNAIAFTCAALAAHQSRKRFFQDKPS
jgi:hypothetical protein